MTQPKTPAYTPKVEFQCDGSTTHYGGCRCHEARRDAEVATLKAQLAESEHREAHFKNALEKYACLNCIDGTFPCYGYQSCKALATDAGREVKG